MADLIRRLRFAWIRLRRNVRKTRTTHFGHRFRRIE